MLKKRLQFSRTAALIVIMAMSGSGVKALVSSFAATGPSGNIKVTSYVFKDGRPAERIGDVTLHIEAVGSPEGCSRNTGRTNADHNNGEHGAVTLESCRVSAEPRPFFGSNGRWKWYRLHSATRANYEFRGVRMNTANGPIELTNGTDFVVFEGGTSSLQVWMEDKTPPPAAPKQPTGPPPPRAEDKNGSLEITSFNYFSGGQLSRQANVKVVLESTHQDNGNPAVRCDETTKTTDTNGGSHDKNPNYAQANFGKCWTSSDGAKEYRFKSIEAPAGYKFRSIHGMTGKLSHGQSSSTNPQEGFEIKKGEKARVQIWLDPPAHEVPPPPSQPVSAPPDAPNKDGRIEVLSYIYESESKQIPQGGVTVSVASVNADNRDGAQTCDQTTKTTDSNGGSRDRNANYAKAHFERCWVSRDGSKQYEVSRIEIPSGYAFTSVRILNGKFTNGTDSANQLGESARFEVSGSKHPQIAVWMKKVELPVAASNSAAAPTTVNKPASTSAGRSTQGSPGAPTAPAPKKGSSVGAVHQVVTSRGKTLFTPANNNQASKNLAGLLNSLVSTNQLNPNFTAATTSGGGSADKCADGDLCEEDLDATMCDDPDMDGCPDRPDEGNSNQPSVPPSLQATQDSSGSILLTWGASSAGSGKEVSSYVIERIQAGQDEDPPMDDTTGTNYLDTGDDEFLGQLKPGQDYTYKVYANDDQDNMSEPAVVNIKTEPIKVNVPAAPVRSNPTPAEANNNEEAENEAAQPVVSIASQVLPVTAALPVEANEEAMACAVSSGEGGSEDLLQSIGPAVVEATQLICREENGEIVEEFDDEVETSFEIEEEDIEDSELYAYDGTDWQAIPVDDEEVKKQEGVLVDYASAKRERPAKGVKGAKTKLKIKSKKPLKLAVVNVKHANSGAPVLAWLLPPFILVAVTGYVLLRRRQDLPPAPSVVSHFKDIDLMPVKQNTTLDYVQPLNKVQSTENYSGVAPSQVIRPEGYRQENNEQK